MLKVAGLQFMASSVLKGFIFVKTYRQNTITFMLLRKNKKEFFFCKRMPNQKEIGFEFANKVSRFNCVFYSLSGLIVFMRPASNIGDGFFWVVSSTFEVFLVLERIMFVCCLKVVYLQWFLLDCCDQIVSCFIDLNVHHSTTPLQSMF